MTTEEKTLGQVAREAGEACWNTGMTADQHYQRIADAVVAEYERRQSAQWQDLVFEVPTPENNLMAAQVKAVIEALYGAKNPDKFPSYTATTTDKSRDDLAGELREALKTHDFQPPTGGLNQDILAEQMDKNREIIDRLSSYVTPEAKAAYTELIGQMKAPIDNPLRAMISRMEHALTEISTGLYDRDKCAQVAMEALQSTVGTKEAPK